MRLSTRAAPLGACVWALLLAAGPAGAVDPIGYLAPDGVNTIPVSASNPLPVTGGGGGGGGGGGPVTAASGAYALGSIVDLGTGASPGAYTTNGYLAALKAGVTIASPANFTPGQASVGATATLIVAARTGRNTVVIENTGTTPVYLGGPGVTTSTGLLLPGVLGASLTLPVSAAIYGVVASGTQTVTEAETY
jgi:hypothetical protein